MKIYDTHSDIFSNIYERTLKGEKDIFKKYHYHDLIEGQVSGGIWVVYSSHDFDIEKAYQVALADFDAYKNEFEVVYGLEGLRNVPNLEVFHNLYQMGIRHAGLTWNEANHLATGVGGEATRGLTDIGKTFLDYMVQNKMIIDVSHLNIKSFYDVLAYTDKNIIASHSNAFTIKNNRRNLLDEQLKALAEVDGYVGAVTARNFVSGLPSKQNVEGLVDQICYMANIIGIDHLMLGLDMMDYLDDEGMGTANLDDLNNHRYTQLIISEMIKRGFSQKEIALLCYQNFEKVKLKLK